MNAEISKEVLGKLREEQRAESEGRIPVIITLEPNYGSDFSSLESEGLLVDRPLSAINAVAGTIPANRVFNLAQQPRIVRIEHDGEVKALETE